ncbi:hypothetical protein A5821_000959 [Enterococcus sp. 7F3_DIV0205]|uniref:DUF2187 domain-containing protein n=1 Tax=Candidatus Enterococcus palustris TaxID=1834189 RepID=A0AAQ3W9E2_9ENTE|nr:hypothetical protein [Enterococcus sp. 7F3_DIV0205]OTN85357.1 hypothetical protein A5821_001302 [Enterococcus sp. 7F3_DIV0205]
MTQEKRISFSWDKSSYQGYVEKEYENAYLVVVSDPSPDMEEKYTNRMVISKKDCKTTD